MENDRLKKAREILYAHNYRRIREHAISQDDIDRKFLLLEWWAGTRGVLILQSEEDEDGVQTYIGWGHGSTWDEFEAAITYPTDTGLFGGIILEGAKDTTPEEQTALDAILPEVLSPLQVKVQAVLNMMEADLWSEHPDFPRSIWQDEVVAGDVQSGYWEWAISQCEQRFYETCVHDWQTTRSYGATVGYDAKCTKCGAETTFTPSDD